MRKQSLCVIVRKCAVGKAALAPSSVTARFTVSSVTAKGTPRHLPHSYAVGKALACRVSEVSSAAATVKRRRLIKHVGRSPRESLPRREAAGVGLPTGTTKWWMRPQNERISEIIFLIPPSPHSHVLRKSWLLFVCSPLVLK